MKDNKFTEFKNCVCLVQTKERDVYLCTLVFVLGSGTVSNTTMQIMMNHLKRNKLKMTPVLMGNPFVAIIKSH